MPGVTCARGKENHRGQSLGLMFALHCLEVSLERPEAVPTEGLNLSGHGCPHFWLTGREQEGDTAGSAPTFCFLSLIAAGPREPGDGKGEAKAQEGWVHSWFLSLSALGAA